jgi:hypothetical protein
MMSRRPKHQRQEKPEVTREQFPDGSALITYPDGGMLILESDLAKESVVREIRPANYNDPAPPPVSES